MHLSLSVSAILVLYNRKPFLGWLDTGLWPPFKLPAQISVNCYNDVTDQDSIIVGDVRMRSSTGRCLSIV